MRIGASHLERKDSKENKDLQQCNETSIDISQSSKDEDLNIDFSKEFHDLKESSINKDQKFQKSQKKPPIDLSPQENPYDLPLKTPHSVIMKGKITK